MSRFAVLFAVALGFAIMSTAFAGAQLLSQPSPSVQNTLSTTSGVPAAPNSSATFSEAAGLSSGNGVTYSTVGGHSPSIPALMLQFFGTAPSLSPPAAGSSSAGCGSGGAG